MKLLPSHTASRNWMPGFLNHTAVIIPALNEIESVGATVEHWLGWGAGVVRVVDNGSDDGTAQAAADAGAEVHYESRPGYGAAAWRGAQHLPDTVEWLLFASADGSDFFDTASAVAFDEAVISGADLVMGERVSRADSRRHLSLVQRIGNALTCVLIAMGWGTRFRDMGSLRLVSRTAFEKLALEDRAFGWNIEMQVRAVEEGLDCLEVPVAYRPRTAGTPKISGNLLGVFRAGRDILGMIARLYFRRAKPATGDSRHSDPWTATGTSPAANRHS